MESFRAIVCAIALLGAGSVGVAAAQAPDDMFYRQQVLDAMGAARAGNDARADALFEAVIADPRFERLPLDERRRLLSSAAWSAVRNTRLAEASTLYGQLAGLGSDDPDDWYRMGLVALDLQDPDAAARAMTVLVGRWPELLPNLGSEVLYPLALQGDTGTPDRVAFQQALFDANWKGGSAGSPGGVWFQLARTRLGQGDLVRARIVARRIADPEVLMMMRADRRFDALLDHGSWRANVAHASTREIERTRLLVEAHPDRIESLVSLVHQLLLAGHDGEAIALVDDALAKIASAPLDAPAFGDLHEQVWLMNHKSMALRRLGRVEEAADELRRASRLGEHGQPNVSQALNLGTLECGRGRPHEALAAAALAGQDGMSAYGRAMRAAIRHCAAHQLGDRAAATAALDELAGLASDAPVRYLEALLLEDRADEAATRLRDLLASNEPRLQLLDWAQTCRLPDPLPAQARRRALREAFLARDDVLAAIDAVGRIEHYDLYCHGNG